MSGSARAARRQAQQRINRILLAGSLGGLALFFGIIVAQDGAGPESPAGQPAQTVQQQDQSVRQPVRPRVRTRTS
jgi:hypothetical protein